VRRGDFDETACEPDHDSLSENRCFQEQSKEVAGRDHVDDRRRGGSDVEFPAGATRQQIEHSIAVASLEVPEVLVVVSDVDRAVQPTMHSAPWSPSVTVVSPAGTSQRVAIVDSRRRCRAETMENAGTSAR